MQTRPPITTSRLITPCQVISGAYTFPLKVVLLHIELPLALKPAGENIQ